MRRPSIQSKIRHQPRLLVGSQAIICPVWATLIWIFISSYHREFYVRKLHPISGDSVDSTIYSMQRPELTVFADRISPVIDDIKL
jgi:hypothetical protein